MPWSRSLMLLPVLLAACGGSAPKSESALRPPEGLPSADHTTEAARYRSACDTGSAQACGYLGFMYDNAFGVARDITLAVDLCERACAGGSAYGCAYLGYLYRLGRGVQKDDERAAALFRRACDDDDLSGCVGLAIMYKSGSGVPRDPDYAGRLFRTACDNGDRVGCKAADQLK